jgi:hypothetical protein
LLWRGSRDGFFATDFHDRCDGHANTLTVIEDTDGNIFGGFTPVEWESCTQHGGYSGCFKSDPSRKTFLFTLDNPHNFPVTKFALRIRPSDHALNCAPSRGPHFIDIDVSDQCNSNTASYTAAIGIVT